MPKGRGRLTRLLGELEPRLADYVGLRARIERNSVTAMPMVAALERRERALRSLLGSGRLSHDEARRVRQALDGEPIAAPPATPA